MNPVVHFEMPAGDTKRMAGYYTRVFGWRTEQLGPEMGDYVLVQTTETEESGFPREAGRINGGFYRRNGENACHFTDTDGNRVGLLQPVGMTGPPEGRQP